jgi:hypothetical protein
MGTWRKTPKPAFAKTIEVCRSSAATRLTAFGYSSRRRENRRPAGPGPLRRNRPRPDIRNAAGELRHSPGYAFGAGGPDCVKCGDVCEPARPDPGDPVKTPKLLEHRCQLSGGNWRGFGSGTRKLLIPREPKSGPIGAWLPAGICHSSHARSERTTHETHFGVAFDGRIAGGCGYRRAV